MASPLLLEATRGDDVGFDVVIPNNWDGSTPDLTGAIITFGIYRDAYTRVVYLEKTAAFPISEQTLSNINYKVVSIDLTSAETAACPAGDRYFDMKVVTSAGTKHTATGTFRIKPSPNP